MSNQSSSNSVSMAFASEIVPFWGDFFLCFGSCFCQCSFEGKEQIPGKTSSSKKRFIKRTLVNFK